MGNRNEFNEVRKGEEKASYPLLQDPQMLDVHTIILFSVSSINSSLICSVFGFCQEVVERNVVCHIVC
jgi:hypothetical protein